MEHRPVCLICPAHHAKRMPLQQQASHTGNCRTMINDNGNMNGNINDYNVPACITIAITRISIVILTVG